MLGYWLLSNVVIFGLLTYLWMWVWQHNKLYDIPVVQISYGLCYLLRIGLIVLVWRAQKNFSGEPNLVIRKREDLRLMSYAQNGESREPLNEVRVKGPYSRAIAKDMFHGSQIELKPYRGKGVRVNCECLASNSNL